MTAFGRRFSRGYIASRQKSHKYFQAPHSSDLSEVLVKLADFRRASRLCQYLNNQRDKRSVVRVALPSQTRDISPQRSRSAQRKKERGEKMEESSNSGAMPASRSSAGMFLTHRQECRCHRNGFSPECGGVAGVGASPPPEDGLGNWGLEDSTPATRPHFIICSNGNNGSVTLWA